MPGRTRFSNLRDDHEITARAICFEAAAAASRRPANPCNLLDVATRYADLLVRTFGEGDGKRAGYWAIPELALVKLANVTGNRAYFDLASLLQTTRGSRFFATEHGDDLAKWDGRYRLDHEPIVQMQRITGHAVRAAYLMAGATDVAATTGDDALLAAVRRIWDNTIAKNVFVTGGIGPSAKNEGFTADFDPPTASKNRVVCVDRPDPVGARGAAHARPAVRRRSRTRLYNAIPPACSLTASAFLREPTREQRHPPPQGVVRLRVLPVEPRAHVRSAGGWRRSDECRRAASDLYGAGRSAGDRARRAVHGRDRDALPVAGAR